MTRLERLRRAPRRAWLLGLAAWLLLLTQSIGFVHSVHHAAGAAPRQQATGPHDRADFGHAAGSAECRVFDQLAHADLAFGAPAAAVVEPPAARSSLPAPRTADGTRAWRAQARGPPAQA